MILVRAISSVRACVEGVEGVEASSVWPEVLEYVLAYMDEAL